MIRDAVQEEVATLISRREMVQNVTGALVAPLVLSRAEAQVTPDIVKYASEIEPLVVLIEKVPREKAAEMVVEQLNRGMTHRQLMAALFLAGVRNVNPRPPGFALHCVFVIHSAHLLGQHAPSDSRLLPLFYALDNFKTAQDRDAKQAAGDYTMRAMSGALPGARDAATDFAAAMESWDLERAERAVVSLARADAAAVTVDKLRRYGARDFRNIGHKAIYVANASRTLDAIGWQYAEPVLRSLVLSLLDFGMEQEVNGYKLADQCYGANLQRVADTFKRLPANWDSKQGDQTATRELLELWRTSTPEEMCADVAKRLTTSKARAGAVWDAVHLASAEIAMRVQGRAGIVGIHAVSSANGLRHAYSVSKAPETRYLLTLQGVGWMGQFQTAANQRESLRTVKITELEPSGGTVSTEEAIAEIFAGIPARADASAGQILRLARETQNRDAVLNAALKLTVTKGDEVHYYKYLAALMEDIPQVSGAWQPYLTAAVAYYAKGLSHPESEPMRRAREAMKSLKA
jgi:hypothetical protein